MKIEQCSYCRYTICKATKNSTKIPQLKGHKVASGSDHEVIIDIDHNVWVFESKKCGQLGLNHTKASHKPTQPPNIRSHKVAIACFHTISINLNNS